MRTQQLHSENMYDTISTSYKFEDVGKGRKMAILVDRYQPNIVRTTMRRRDPPQAFGTNLDPLRNALTPVANNAMLEIYDGHYKTMGFHSDQDTDLCDHSEIGIASFYKDTKEKPRQLVIKKKGDTEETYIDLSHNSIVIFSTEFNRNHVHKIIGESQWLGITLRCSKTPVTFIDRIPHLPDGKPLRLATEGETREFYRKKSEQNGSTVMWDIPYTICEGDLYEPVGSM